METTTPPVKILYTGKTHTTGGREQGVSKSSDGRLEVKLSTPGSEGPGTNPEQLFAAGWSACFEAAMGIGAARMGVILPATTAIDAEVRLCIEKGEYFLQAALTISTPGLDREIAQQIIDYAERTCPYSKAIRNNVAVQLRLA